MLYKIALGEGKWLVIEDWMDNKKFVKISVQEDNGTGSITLGLVEKDDLKRIGKSL